MMPPTIHCIDIESEVFLFKTVIEGNMMTSMTKVAKESLPKYGIDNDEDMIFLMVFSSDVSVRVATAVLNVFTKQRKGYIVEKTTLREALGMSVSCNCDGCYIVAKDPNGFMIVEVRLNL